MSHSRATRVVVALTAAWSVVVCARSAAWQQPPTAPPAAQAGKPPSADERSTLAGVYTDKQADAGADIFSNICANCHKPAEHASPAFKSKWTGAVLWDLYETIGATMPKDDPESLTEPERAQIVAFLLRKNGLPAGTTDLSTDPAALKKIRIEMPKEKTMAGPNPRIGYLVIGY